MSDPTTAATSKYPQGLTALAMTEMWERFSYYGMRSILVLYMTAAVMDGGIGLDDASATAIYGIYIGAVFVFSIPGGWIADRYIGARLSVVIGGALLCLGNVAVALGRPEAFYLGLLLSVLGVGLLKPNVSVLVGRLYDGRSDSSRDSGFMMFYLAINVGAFLAPMFIGTVGEKFSWRAGYLLAAALMLVGIAQFCIRFGILDPVERVRGRTPAAAWTLVLLATAGTMAVAWALVAAVARLASHISVPLVTQGLGVAICLLCCASFARVYFDRGLGGEERARLRALGILFLAIAVFVTGYELAGSTFSLFARDHVDRSLLGGLFADGSHPASWYQAVGPILIIALSPVLSWLWRYLGNRERDLSVAQKFGLGLVLVAAGFLVMSAASWLVVNHQQRVAPTWLLLTYLLHTLGELCVSPIGLSAVTRLTPQRFVGQMMGIWFGGVALGNLLSGLLAGLLGSASLANAPTRFLMIASMDVVAGVVLFALSRKISTMMR
ncbi:MAG: peptide MFS transporter [Pseudomonas sp.]